MPKPLSKRAAAMVALKVAGYHGDSKSWCRIYVENRISREVADEQWALGVKAASFGMPCSCGSCLARKNEVPK